MLARISDPVGCWQDELSCRLTDALGSPQRPLQAQAGRSLVP